MKKRDIMTPIPTMNFGPRGMTPPVGGRNFCAASRGNLSFFKFLKRWNLLDVFSDMGSGVWTLYIEGAVLANEAVESGRRRFVVDKKE